MAGLNLMGRLTSGSVYEEPPRTAEVALSVEDGETTEQPKEEFQDKDDPATYMIAYQQLKTDIDKISDNTGKIDGVISQLMRATSNSEEKEVMGELTKLMADNTSLSQTVKQQLKDQKFANDKFAVDKPGSSVAQWRINQLNACTRKFQLASNNFQGALNRFNTELKNRQQRHIGLIDKKLSGEEIENLVSDPARAQMYIQQSFQLVDTGDAMMDRLAEIETRTEGMQKIYESLEELRTMWQELNFLINEQQEYLDSIENNVQQTKEYITQATDHLKSAEKSQKTSRKLRYCMLCVCLILLIAIFGALGGSGTFTNGS